MSDLEVQTRAIQERGFKEGKIPTNFWSAAAKTAAADKSLTGAAMTGAGLLVGGPVGAGIVAASPLAAEGVKSAVTGEAPSTADVATDAAMGAATLGPAMFAKVGGTLASEVANTTGGTLPQALAKAGGKIVAPLAKDADMLTPQAISKTGSEIWEAMKQGVVRMRAGLSSGEVDLMRGLVKQGYKPSTAASIVGAKDATKMNALMELYRRASVGIKP